MSEYVASCYYVALQNNEGEWFLTIPALSFTDASDQGESLRREGSCKDFAVYRVLFNSRTPLMDNYDVRPVRK